MLEVFNPDTERGQAILNLIRLAPDVEEADKLITDACGFTTTAQKFQFLQDNFPGYSSRKTINPNITEDERLESDYFCFLTVITEDKWR